MIAKKCLQAFALTMAIVVPSLALAQARRFDVHGGESRIAFESDAPLETISGVSTSVSGRIRVDPDDLSTASGRIEVPVASLRTGIDLRDEHLRGDGWLDARRFPNARFEVAAVTGARALRPGTTMRVQIRGRFTIHGVTREVTAPAQIDYRPRERGAPAILAARATFKISLPRYGVSVPSLVRLKVSDEITVRVRLRLHEARPQQASNR